MGIRVKKGGNDQAMASPRVCGPNTGHNGNCMVVVDSAAQFDGGTYAGRRDQATPHLEGTLIACGDYGCCCVFAAPEGWMSRGKSSGGGSMEQLWI